MDANGRLTICQISDIHCGNARFVPDLLDRAIIEINRMNPAAVVVSGDLTDAGYREEFEEAAEYIDRIECEFITETFSEAGDKLKIFVVHHHLIPLPGTGRERNIVFDAGDVLQRLIDVGVNLVLSGHKHVPYTWKLEDMIIVNAGTASTLRLRGDTRPCYNIIEVENGKVEVFRKYPFKRRELAVSFEPAAQQYSRSKESTARDYR